MSSFGSMTDTMGNANQVLGAPSALNQVGPGSPSFQPGLLPPPANMQGAPQMPLNGPSPIPGAQPTPAQLPMPQMEPSAPQMPTQPMGGMGQPQQGPVVGMPPGNPESLMILKALTSRLSSITKGEEMSRGQ